MNGDNDFDRFNHEDYDSLGYRKTGNIFGYDDEDRSDIRRSRDINRRNETTSVDWRVTRGAIFMPIIFIGILFFGTMFGFNKTSNDSAKKFVGCLNKAETLLKEKYNINEAKMSANVSYKNNTQFCEIKVNANDKEFYMTFDLNSDSLYDSYQEDIVIDYISKSLEKYDVKVIGLEARSSYLDNEKLANNNYFKEYFNGSNLDKVLNGYTVNVFVEKELSQEVVRFSSENGINTINFIALKDGNIYRGIEDIDSYSLNINKLIEIKNKQINKYKYDVLNIDGINIVFKGHVYDLEEEPTMEKTMDGCYSIKYSGFRDPGDGIFRGNIINIFSDKTTLIKINGTDYMTGTCPLLSCKTKIGVPNGPIKVCLK